MFFAVLLALAIGAFVIEPYRISSTSMLPTLLVGDHLFVNKFVYGPKIPFTELRLPGLREPERGDVSRKRKLLEKQKEGKKRRKSPDDFRCFP